MPYLGNEPAVAYTSTTKDSFSGDASTTDFTMSKSANVNAVRVVVENVVQNPTVAYTCSGTTLSFTSAPPTGTNNIYVVHLGPPAATVAPPSTINNPTTFTGGVTLKNETPEDTDGGRESIVTFQGTQSGSEISTLAQIQASHDATADDQKGDLIFKTNDGSDGASPTEAMRIQSDQKIGVGLSSNISSALHVNSEVSLGPDNNNRMIVGSTSGGVGSIGTIEGGTASFNTMRFTGGKATVGKTTSGVANVGAELRNGSGDYAILGTSSAAAPFIANRTSNNGEVFQFRQDNTQVFSMISYGASSEFSIGGTGTNTVGLYFSAANQLLPTKANSLIDASQDIGKSNFRWAQIFASVGTIQTSDENEKQNIGSLTSAEITAATAISKLFKTYKWKDAVAKKGDDARTHTGVIAQQIQTTMSDAGLDASKYGFWCSDTWWEKDVEVAAVEADEENGIEAKDAYTRTDSYDIKDEAPEGSTEHTRMGIRYAELLSFVGAATEQRLTIIETENTAIKARLDALEAG